MYNREQIFQIIEKKLNQRVISSFILIQASIIFMLNSLLITKKGCQLNKIRIDLLLRMINTKEGNQFQSFCYLLYILLKNQVNQRYLQLLRSLIYQLKDSRVHPIILISISHSSPQFKIPSLQALIKQFLMYNVNYELQDMQLCILNTFQTLIIILTFTASNRTLQFNEIIYYCKSYSLDISKYPSKQVHFYIDGSYNLVNKKYVQQQAFSHQYKKIPSFWIDQHVKCAIAYIFKITTFNYIHTPYF
ncbi:hypothetical protein pb186bvf_014428 [Paramecium bursaria]